MDDFETRLRKIIKQSKIFAKPDINTILIVLDETQDREDFIFNLVQQLHKRTDASFIFLLAVRGYLSQAQEAHIDLETLPELIAKVKKRFLGEKDIFNVAFIPDEAKKPFDWIEEIIQRRKIDLLVIPAPFTLFAKEERSINSLGATVDQVLTEVLVKNGVPIFLVQKSQEIPFKNLTILIRKSMFRKDFLGWLIALLSSDAHITAFHSDLDEKELERVELYLEIMKRRLEKDDRRITMDVNEETIFLKEFCARMSKEANSLIVFQVLKGLEDDAKRISNTLCSQTSNVLIFPPKN